MSETENNTPVKGLPYEYEHHLSKEIALGNPEADTADSTRQPAAESFFLDNFNLDRLFRGIERGDYIFLYYIRQCQNETPDEEKVYLSRLAEAMNLSVTAISGAVERLQDRGYVLWGTDAALGKTYVVLTSKSVELMNEEKERMKRSYEAIVQEIGMGELAGTVSTLRKIMDIIRRTNAPVD